MDPHAESVIRLESVVTRFGRQTVHQGVSFAIQRGMLNALIEGSGSGKTVLLREIIGLQRPTSGSIRLLGTDVWKADQTVLADLRQRLGMMFQDGALFSSLSVAQNVAVPLVEHTKRPAPLIEAIVRRTRDQFRFYTIYFERSPLDGVQVGGDVEMRGIKVGRVEDYAISAANINRVQVKIRVDRRRR